MKNQNIFELESRIQSHFSKNEFQEALQLIEQNQQKFPDQFGLLHFWKITLAASEGDHHLALDLLGESTRNGFWYSEFLLRSNPNLKSLHGDLEFESLVERNLELKSLDKTLQYPALVVRPEGSCQIGGLPCPLLIALHDNRSTAYRSLPLWEPAAEAGWLVSAVQSSQGLWKDGYVWVDPEFTAVDVKKGFTSIIKQYEIQSDRVVLAGISESAFIAIQIAVEKLIPARGFIALLLDGSARLDSLDRMFNLSFDQSNLNTGHLIIDTAYFSLQSINRLIQSLENKRIYCSTDFIDSEKSTFDKILSTSLIRGLQSFT